MESSERRISDGNQNGDGETAGAENESDARRVHQTIPKRFMRYGLEVHPDKTRIVDFRKPSPDRKEKPGTFDFLGFTFHWGWSVRYRDWFVKRRTASKKFKKAAVSITEWVRSNRHKPVWMQQRALAAKLRGHYAYYGIRGNYPCLLRFYRHTVLAWREWLSRRAQHRTTRWDQFIRILERHPLPRPRIVQTSC